MYGWDYLEITAKLLSIAVHLAKHGVLGYVVSFVAFFLISIIQFAVLGITKRFHYYKVNSDAVYFIMRSSLVLAFLLGVLSHMWLDGILFTPLNPPLDLKIPAHLITPVP